MNETTRVIHDTLKSFAPFVPESVETPEEREEFERIPDFLKPGHVFASDDRVLLAEEIEAANSLSAENARLRKIIKRATCAPSDSHAVSEILLERPVQPAIKPTNRANLSIEAWGQKWDVKASFVRGYQQTWLEPGVADGYEIEGIYLPDTLIDLSEMLDSKLVESIQHAADRAAQERS